MLRNSANETVLVQFFQFFTADDRPTTDDGPRHDRILLYMYVPHIFKILILASSLVVLTVIMQTPDYILCPPAHSQMVAGRNETSGTAPGSQQSLMSWHEGSSALDFPRGDNAPRRRPRAFLSAIHHEENVSRLRDERGRSKYSVRGQGGEALCEFNYICMLQAAVHTQLA